MSLESGTNQRIKGNAAPIFILGMMPRTGTHFLGNLLCLHPDCAKSVLAEDALTANAHVLARYVEKLEQGWRSTMGDNCPAEGDELFQCLGHGLIEFLHRTRRKVAEARVSKFNQPLAADFDDKRLVTKSPWVHNLDLFFRLFPRAPLLVLIRRGPETVESYVQSFAPAREMQDYEQAMHYWVRGAQTILRWRNDTRDGKPQPLIVRYEDLHQNTEHEMRRVLAFLELDVTRYDFDAMRNVPVVGSSTFKRGEDGVHWLPVRKTADFDPLARATGWTLELHARFHDLAGVESAQLGYTTRS
jgi:hypothetical protein